MSNSLMQPDLQLDTTLTKEGYAADSKAVGDKIASIPDIEYGCWKSSYVVSDKNIKSGTIMFSHPRSSPPKSVVISYRVYSYFYGELHLDTNIATNGVDGYGIYWAYIPIEIGNGQSPLYIDWIAIW